MVGFSGYVDILVSSVPCCVSHCLIVGCSAHLVCFSLSLSLFPPPLSFFPCLFLSVPFFSLSLSLFFTLSLPLSFPLFLFLCPSLFSMSLSSFSISRSAPLCPSLSFSLSLSFLLSSSPRPLQWSSMPLVADLLETCIDDVIRTPVPIVTAGLPEEAGPSAAQSASNVAADDNLSLNEAAARLKQLELENNPMSVPSRTNINLNMNMNNQEDVVKLTEKCLNSVGTSPQLAPLRSPEDLKSNILKAQAEAALKGTVEDHVVMGDKNCNMQEAARLKVRSGRMGSNSSLSLSGRPERQESWDLLKPTLLSSGAGASDEMLAEDLIIPSLPIIPSEAANEGLVPKAKAEDQEPPSVPLIENLIDFTDLTPVLPPVQPKPAFTPRWIVPTAAPPGVFTNGLLDLDTPVKVTAPLHPDGGALATLPLLPQTHNVIATSPVSQQASMEDGHKPKGVLTTEL